MLIAAATILGLIFGSFATVVAYRLPTNLEPQDEKSTTTADHQSIVSGRSHCPNCGHVITASENIPLVSYLFQRGRCRHCGHPISPRYPFIEASTAALFALAAWKFGLSAAAVVYAGFFWALVVLSVIDLEYKKLYNVIVYPTFLAGWVGLIVACFVDDTPAVHLEGAALGALIFGGFLFLVAFVYPAGMGMGDVKLALVLGTFLGYEGHSLGRAAGMTLTGMFFSFFAGGLIGLAIILVRRGDRKTQVPFGPFLALGTVVAIFAGQAVLNAYLGSF
jgi:leader peptidase (prepilin peptidase)/N-methyltransferase